MSQRKRQKERAERAVLDRVRGRLVSGIHSDHLKSGDRLPSYRETADETGLDLRAVMRLYQTLAEEGLVEIRGRSGVFVTEQERIGGRVLAETARWTIGVVREAWRRHIPVQRLPEFIRECTATVTVRCACVESTTDQVERLRAELHRDFGFESAAVHADRLPHHPDPDAPTSAEWPSELRAADFLVTTAFHAATLRPLASSLGKPLVIVRLNRDLTRAVERRVAEGPWLH